MLAVFGWLSLGLTVSAADPPDHYFVGRVCRVSRETQLSPAGYPCEKPVRGASVTIRNSIGQVERATTDAEGKYVLIPMPLYGTDQDAVTFEAKGLEGVRVGRLHFDPRTAVADRPGATILLRKQRVERVTIQ